MKWHAQVLKEEATDEVQFFCIERAKKGRFHTKASEESIQLFEQYFHQLLTENEEEYNYTNYLFHFGDSYVNDERRWMMEHLKIYSSHDFFSDVYVHYPRTGDGPFFANCDLNSLEFVAEDYSMEAKDRTGSNKEVFSVRHSIV